jgi:hypothetical protein
MSRQLAVLNAFIAEQVTACCGVERAGSPLCCGRLYDAEDLEIVRDDIAALVEAAAKFRLAYNDREAGGHSRREEDQIVRELINAGIALDDALASFGEPK